MGLSRRIHAAVFSFISRERIEQVVLCIVVLFHLGWRDVSDRSMQASVVTLPKAI